MVEVGRDLWRPNSSPAGAPRAGRQGGIQAAIEDLQGGDCTAPGQPVLVLHHLHTEGQADVTLPFTLDKALICLSLTCSSAEDTML